MTIKAFGTTGVKKLDTLKVRLLTGFTQITAVFVLSTTSAYAVPAVLGSGCGLNSADTSRADFLYPDSASGISLSYLSHVSVVLLSGSPTQSLGGALIKRCHFSTLPTSIDTDCDTTATEIDMQTNYVAAIHEDAAPEPTYCLYSYDVDTSAADVRTNGAVAAPAPLEPANPTAVPIFTPLGLLATLFGFLWFGRRKVKS